MKKNKSYLNNLSNHLFIANWSLSEAPIKYRKNFIKLITKSNLILICFQEKFEGTNNLKYFNDLKKKLSHAFKVKIIKNTFYKGNIFHKHNFRKYVVNTPSYLFLRCTQFSKRSV